MIELYEVISWKENFAAKRMIFHIHPSTKTTEGSKIEQGVSGQSRCTNRYFVTAPILSQIYSKMLRPGGKLNSNSKFYHQLGNAQ